MAATLGADSLRYLPVESIARAIGFDADQLCQACITGEYPSKIGQQLYQIALGNAAAPNLSSAHLRNAGRRHHRLRARARLARPAGDSVLSVRVGAFGRHQYSWLIRAVGDSRRRRSPTGVGSYSGLNRPR